MKIIASIPRALVVALITTFASWGCAAESRRIEVSVTAEGFAPKQILVKKNEQVALVFTRTTEKTCAKEVVIYVSDKNKIQKTLPLNEAVTVETKFAKSGEVRFACGMNMLSGSIVVE